MAFLNPYDLIDISAAMDDTSLRKSIKQVLTTFDLSDDGTLEVYNRTINKNDFLKAIEIFDNPDQAFFCRKISEIPALNAFLSTGNTAFFKSYRTEECYDDAAFRAFVSPYFAQQYDRALFQAFRTKNIDDFISLTNGLRLVRETDTDKAYQSLSGHLDALYRDVTLVYQNLCRDGAEYDLLQQGRLLEQVQSSIPLKLINLLPDYFEAQRVTIALMISDISAHLFNVLKEIELAASVMQFARSINTDRGTHAKLTENCDIIQQAKVENERRQRRFEQRLAQVEAIEALFLAEKDNDTPRNLSFKRSVQEIQPSYDLPGYADNEYLTNRLAGALYNLAMLLFHLRGDISEVSWLLERARSLGPSAEVVEYLDDLAQKVKQFGSKVVEAVLSALGGLEKNIRDNETQKLREGFKQASITQWLIQYFSQDGNSAPFEKILNEAFLPSNIEMLANATLAEKEKIVALLERILPLMPKDFRVDLIIKLYEMVKRNPNLRERLSLLIAVKYNYLYQPSQSISTVYTTSTYRPQPPAHLPVPETDDDELSFNWDETMAYFFTILFLIIIFIVFIKNE